MMKILYLVNSPQGRHIHGLPPHSSGAADTGGILAWAGVDDGVDHDLERILAGQQVDDLEAVLHNPHGHQLLAIVPPVHHQRVDQALNDRALGFAEPLGSVSRIKQ